MKTFAVGCGLLFLEQVSMHSPMATLAVMGAIALLTISEPIWLRQQEGEKDA